MGIKNNYSGLLKTQQQFGTWGSRIRLALGTERAYGEAKVLSQPGLLALGFVAVGRSGPMVFLPLAI